MMISAASGFINQSEKYSRENAGQSLKKYTLLKQGELAYNHGASKLRQFGCCFELKEKAARIPYVYHTFSIKEKEYAPYIAILLNNPIMDRQLKRLVSSSVRMDGLLNISYDEYMSIKVSIPTQQAEQRKIFAFIEKMEQRIAKQRQLVEALKSYKRGVSNRIFRGMSDPSWHTICLGEICSITMGQSPDSNSYNTDGIGLPLVQGNADITNGLTTPLRYTSNPTKVCENGSVILSVRAPVGTVSRANQRVCLGRGVCAIASSNTDFIYQLLLCYQDSWKRIEQGGTFAAISGDDISSFSVEIPDCELQNRIAVFLSQFDTKIRNEEKILLELQKQKAALLQQLFI